MVTIKKNNIVESSERENLKEKELDFPESKNCIIFNKWLLLKICVEKIKKNKEDNFKILLCIKLFFLYTKVKPIKDM